MVRTNGYPILFLLLVGCGDLTQPSIASITVMQGEMELASVVPNSTKETVIMTDVPADAHFLVQFTEPIQLASAQEKMRINDSVGAEIEIEITQRLNDITLRPASLALEMNHVLEADRGIKDTSGNSTGRNYRVAFFTVAP